MAMLLTSLIGLKVLSAKLDTLEYETFMIQHFPDSRAAVR